MNSSNRVVFGSGVRGGHHLLPEVFEIGWGHFVDADSGHLSPHAHADAFEICLILSGEVEWATTDHSYILREGDLYLTRPNELHWGQDSTMHPCELYWLILGSPRCRIEWPDMDPELVGFLDRRLADIGTHRVSGTPELATLFKVVFEEHATNARSAGSLLLSRGKARAALHSLLIELTRSYQVAQERDERTSVPAELTRAIELLHKNSQDPDVINRVHESVGLDARKLNRQFAEHLGITASQYWLRERIRMARKRLMDPTVRVTDVAAELGFSSSQHFATVFRKITGLTPSAYRQSHQSAGTPVGV